MVHVGVEPLPKYPLKQVFDLLRAEKIWFSAHSRSIERVAEVFRNKGTPMSTIEVAAFIIAGMLTLTLDDWVCCNMQWGTFMDIYGLHFKGEDWYVKFSIDTDGEVEQVSFHPPEEELKSVKGRVYGGKA